MSRKAHMTCNGLMLPRVMFTMCYCQPITQDKSCSANKIRLNLLPLNFMYIYICKPETQAYCGSNTGFSALHFTEGGVSSVSLPLRCYHHAHDCDTSCCTHCTTKQTHVTYLYRDQVRQAAKLFYGCCSTAVCPK